MNSVCYTVKTTAPILALIPLIYIQAFAIAPVFLFWYYSCHYTDFSKRSNNLISLKNNYRNLQQQV